MIIKPEIALLAACARSQQTDFNIKIIGKLLSENIDWERIINMAIYHKVMPLLHKTLITHFKHEVPGRVLEKISDYFAKNSLFTMALSAALVNVLRILNQNGIDVLPVKGALLAERLYGSFAMRTYGDLDILVRQEDFEKSLDVLQKNNYTLVPEGISRSTFLKFSKFKYHGQLLDQTGACIELHWELTGFYVSEPITLESLKPFLIKSSVFDYQVLDLSNEMLFLFLCMHGNRHQLNQIDFICSIAELIEKSPNLDWKLILELGLKYKMIRRILLVMVLVNKLFNKSVPFEIEQLIKEQDDIMKVASNVMEFKDSYITEKKILRGFFKYQLAIMDNKREAIRFIGHSLVVPHQNDWMKIKLANIFFGFYFLYKPWSIITIPIVRRIKNIFRSKLQ